MESLSSYPECLSALDSIYFTRILLQRLDRLSDTLIFSVPEYDNGPSPESSSISIESRIPAVVLVILRPIGLPLVSPLTRSFDARECVEKWIRFPSSCSLRV